MKWKLTFRAENLFVYQWKFPNFQCLAVIFAKLFKKMEESSNNMTHMQNLADIEQLEITSVVVIKMTAC